MVASSDYALEAILRKYNWLQIELHSTAYAHYRLHFLRRKFLRTICLIRMRKGLYNEFGEKILLNLGYEGYWKDQFCEFSDSPASSKRRGETHRNFMGYTTYLLKMLIGLRSKWHQ